MQAIRKELASQYNLLTHTCMHASQTDRDLYIQNKTKQISDGCDGEKGSGRETRRAVQTVRGNQHHPHDELAAIDDRRSSLSVSTALDVAAASDKLTGNGIVTTVFLQRLTKRKPPPRTYRGAI